jgi:hypothetical protein
MADRGCFRELCSRHIYCAAAKFMFLLVISILMPFVACDSNTELGYQEYECFACSMAGFCGTSVKDGSCYLRSGSDCESSLYCAIYGWCSSNGERCVAGKTTDCQQSSTCATEGKCGLDKASGVCVPTDKGCESICLSLPAVPCNKGAGKKSCHARSNDQPCADTLECIELGHCTDVGGLCMALTDEDCAHSKTCTLEGKCAAREGICAPPSDDWCKARKECAERGNCVMGKFFDCEATEEDCDRVCWGGPTISFPVCRLTPYNICF